MYSYCFFKNFAHNFKTVHKTVYFLIAPFDKLSDMRIKLHLRHEHRSICNLFLFHTIFLFQQRVERLKTPDGNSPLFLELKSQNTTLHYDLLHPFALLILNQLQLFLQLFQTKQIFLDVIQYTYIFDKRLDVLRLHVLVSEIVQKRSILLVEVADIDQLVVLEVQLF